MHISAQISLYPLKQQRLSPVIEEAWRILEENSLAEMVFNAIQEVFMRSAEKGSLSMVVTFSNACPI